MASGEDATGTRLTVYKFIFGVMKVSKVASSCVALSATGCSTQPVEPAMRRTHQLIPTRSGGVEFAPMLRRTGQWKVSLLRHLFIQPGTNGMCVVSFSPFGCS